MHQTISTATNERIARLLSTGLELRDSFAALVVEMKEFAAYDYARLLLLDEAGENCRLAAEDGNAPGMSLGSFSYAGSGMEAAIKAGRPIYVQLDVASQPPIGMVREFAAALVLPLTFDQQGVGAVELYTNTAAKLKVSRKQEQALITISYFFSAIVRNSMLYSQLASRNEQLVGALDRAARRATELDSVINQMIDGVAITDAVGKIVRLNTQAEEIMGRPQDKVSLADHAQAYGLYTANDEPYPTEWLPLYAALKQRRTVTDATIFVHRPDQPTRAVVFSASPLLDEAGEVTGAVLMMRDVTNVRAAERIRDEFTANISHELRTPLASILGYSEIMLRRGNLNDRQRQQQEAIRSNAQRLLLLVNDLLDVSRLEVGILGLEMRPLDLKLAIATAAAHIANAADRKRIALSQAVSDDLPPAWADEQRVNQILVNLLSNAVKFTPEGGSISVRADLLTAPREGEPAMLAVQVSDSGIGLASEQLERIWDRFYQVESASTRRFGGAGLGLAISKRLVELHGGRILATSGGLGEGTTVTFTLPLATMQPAAPINKRDIGQLPAPRTDTDTPLVLVVEDDRDFADVLTTMLADIGYRTAHTSDGQQVVALARSLHPAVVTLDINLPRADGWSVLNQLKSDPDTAAIPVIIVSIVDNKRFGFSLGANDYLIKPVERSQLFATMSRVLGNVAVGQTIMLVDDDPSIRDLLRANLAEAGWEVCEAENGKIALERILADPPSLIILDLMLPQLDGFAVLRAIRQSPDPRINRLPVIVITAKNLTVNEREELANSAQRTLFKAGRERDDLARTVAESIAALRTG